MLKRLFGQDIHQKVHLFAFSAMGMGLILSKVILSLSLMLALLNLLLEADFKQYGKNIQTNRISWGLFAFFGLHLIALIWTDNLAWAFDDLRVKLPLLLIPLVLAAQPIPSSKWKYILWPFVAVVLLTSVINFVVFQFNYHAISSDDIRSLCLFGSHIRYALLVVMAIVILVKGSQFLTFKKMKTLIVLSVVWLVFYTFYSQVISGIIALVIVSSYFLAQLIWKKSKLIFTIAASLSLVALMIFAFYLFTPPKRVTINFNQLPKYTAKGNTYNHDLNPIFIIRGKPFYINVCEKEITEEWESHSRLTIMDLDAKGQRVKITLLRYLDAAGFTKDAAGMSRLKEEDYRAIELGFTEPKTQQYSFLNRLEELRFEIHDHLDPNGHSLLQRIEYWKTAIHLIQHNWLIGVGTGDLDDVFQTQYEKENSVLWQENRHRAHNMYLTVWVTFGIFGLVLFLGLLVQFIRSNLQHGMAIGFILISMSSFLMEDTLETQVGITFFAFFFALFSSWSASKTS